ncbi:glycosyltransferase family 4 protein [Haloterrigena salifodinae]|uniref:glycosyltransferase family 4 protein n=1 Tax=Haloterrigena salifodinae TaxID=2675099 RepID=UPI000F88170C|nr:glycosyltransferase family 4 protein [Haloterrigena salifodinae]
MKTVALTGTFNTSDTGPSRVLEGLSEALADTGLEVHAFTHGDREEHPHSDVHVTRFEKTPQSISGFFSYFKWVRGHVRDLDPDVFHPLEEYPFKADIRMVQWTSDSYERWRLCRDDFRGYGYFAGDILLNIANRIGASRTDIVVASSPETKRQMKEYWWFPPDTVVPLGISAETRTPPSKVSDPPRILLPGRITPKKGQRVFLNGLDPESEDYQVDIVGGVSDEVYWESMAEWHGHHHGFVSREKLTHLYKKADIVAVPAVHENFSITALEAIANSCALVITESCGFAQLDVARRSSGVVTVESMAKSASETINLISGGRIQDKKESSYKLSEQFTWKNTSQEYIKIYERL